MCYDQIFESGFSSSEFLSFALLSVTHRLSEFTVWPGDNALLEPHSLQ